MKNIILLAAFLALVLGVLRVPSTAHAAGVAQRTHLAASAAGAQTFQFSFSGKFAEAGFDSVSGCIETAVYVNAVNGRVRVTGSPNTLTATAFTFISQSDLCTGVDLFAAEGLTTLTPSAFQIDHQLNTATLNTTIEVFDFVSGNSFPVDARVSWTGIGASVTETSHFQIREPGFVRIEHFIGTFRNANASGSVLRGGTNLTPDPAVVADLQSAITGSVSVFH